MSNIKWTALTLAAILAAAGSVRAEGVIKERKENQQDRIGQGVESGQLTAGEAARLERQEARLNRETRRMRESGGTLTPRERRRVNRQQNHLSREIYRDKHNRRHQ